MPKKSSNNLHNADSAVAEFLDVLLQEATEPPPAKPTLSEPARVLLMPDLELSPQALEIPAEKPQKKIPADTRPAEIVKQTTSRPQPQDSQPESVEPKSRSQDYAYPLQCLMFKVGQQSLSIPLIDLGSVQPFSERLTCLPDTPDWFLGIFQYRDGQVKVADSARVLDINETGGDSTPRHLLIFGDNEWAISCDKLGEVRQLQHEDIQWSLQSSQLALGTIRDSLAVLLDPEKILKRLQAHTA